MWVSKSAEDRKRDFLDAAAKLFASKGYEKTTVNDIIAAVGVTKGSFYHHYRSKEEVVEALIAELSESLIRALHAAAGESLPPTSKLAAIMSAAVAFRAERSGQYAVLYPILSRDENHPLARRFQMAVAQEAQPLLASAIRQGNQEGVFHASDADRTAGLIQKLTALFKAELATTSAGVSGIPLSKEDAAAEAAFWQDTLERVLGSAQGALPVAALVTQTFVSWKGVEPHDHS